MRESTGLTGAAWHSVEAADLTYGDAVSVAFGQVLGWRMTMLRKSLLIATAMSAVVWGGAANAATLISVAVTGGPPLAPSGTVWDTNNANTYYTLFIAPNNGFGSPSPAIHGRAFGKA